MKPKTKPKIKESIKQLEPGQSVEFRMDSVKECTVRSTCSRLNKEQSTSLKVTNYKVTLGYRVEVNYPTIKVTRL